VETDFFLYEVGNDIHLYKIHPVIGYKSPEGKQNFVFTVSLISALDEGVWSTPLPGRFTPGKDQVPNV
jgi:hypothetical protein